MRTKKQAKPKRRTTADALRLVAKEMSKEYDAGNRSAASDLWDLLEALTRTADKIQGK